MLMTIIIILGIAWVGLAVFNQYVVPMFRALGRRGAEQPRPSVVVIFSGHRTRLVRLNLAQV